MTTTITLEEDGVALAGLRVDILPRPGEQIRLTFTSDKPPRVASFEVVRVAHVADVNENNSPGRPPWGTASIIVEVRALSS